MSDVYIGRYRVIEELGRGGMGIVYRGEDPALERPVAIKVLPPKKLSQKKAIKRFLREARLSARLEHGNIVKVHDIGEEEGIYHIVMELVDGKSLRDLIEERESIQEINIVDTIEIYMQILRALEYAHKRKVVHRDIKPDNIKITTEGVVKVMDFGLAVLEDRHSLTEMGQVMGTIAYFSPEQAKGEPADSRADIYSLGAIFFEMLTNQLVFHATNPGEMISKHLTSPPPNPRMYNPAIPPVVSNLILRTLKKNPEDRIQTVTEMLEILEEWLSQKKFTTKPLEQMRPSSSSFNSGSALQRKSSSGRSRRDDRGRRSSEYMESHFDREGDSAFEKDYGKPESILNEPPPYTPPGEPLPDYSAKMEPPANFDRTEEMVTKIPVRPESQKGRRTPPPGKNVTPTAGESPVASTQWMQEAESENRWDKYQYVLDQIKKDEDARVAAGYGAAVSCPRCGAENDPNRKYCLECGNLISHSQFMAQKEAQAHNEKGLELMRENKLVEASNEFNKAIEKDPYYVEGYMNMAKVLGDLGEYQKARKYYREVLRLNPNQSQPHILIADLYRLEGKKDEAIYEYREASKIEPSNINIRNQLALLYSQKGDMERAIDEYQRILTVDPDNFQTHRQLGYMLMAMDRNQEAIREFEWVLTVDPDDEEVYQILGGLYLKVGRLRNAEEVFQTALTINPDDSEAIAQLGEIYEKQNREDLALQHLSQAVEVDETNTAARQKLADIYERHSRDDLAIVELEKASQFQPDDPDIHGRLGDIYLRNQQVDKALLHYERTVEMEPSSAQLHHKLATLYSGKEYSELSINEFKKAVHLEPYNPEYREDLGMALYSQKRLHEAISEIRKAATLDSTNVEYHKALGLMYDEAGEYDQAVKAYQKAIQVTPRDPMAQGMLGRVYSHQGLMSMAVYQYQKALMLNPDSHLFHVYLGKAFSQQGKAKEAVAAFKRAIELAPGGKTAKGSRILAKAYADLGRVYLEQGELRKALDVLQSAEKNNPNDPKTLHYLGLLYTESNKLDKAYDYLAKALKLQPNSAEIMRDLTNIYEKRKDYTLAMSVIKKAIMYEPDNIEGYEILARILQKTGRRTEAQGALDDGLRHCPNDADYAYWLKGGIASESGDWKQAADLYKRAITLNDNDWTYHKDLARAYEELQEYELSMNEINNALACGPDDRFSVLLRKDLKRLKKKRKSKGAFF